MDQLKIESLPGRNEGERILKLVGPFTLDAVFDFQSITRQHSAPVTILDLSEVPYMDSAALGSILGFHASCQRENRKAALVGVCGRIGVLFKISRVETLLKCYASVPEAQEALVKEASA